jgi:hypothetical protein
MVTSSLPNEEIRNCRPGDLFRLEREVRDQKEIGGGEELFCIFYKSSVI